MGIVRCLALGWALVLALPGRERAVAPPDGTAAVRSSIAAYPAAWLSGDPAAVRRLFADDAVLLPSGGHPPVRGRREIDAFFWPPDAPPIRVRELSLTPREISRRGDLAYSWGDLSLTFESAAKDGARRSSSAGTYLMVLRWQEGQWKIARYMWNVHSVPSG